MSFVLEGFAVERDKNKNEFEAEWKIIGMCTVSNWLSW